MTDRELFDAREALLSESTDQPDGRWRIVSLVTAARGLVTWTPAGQLPWPPPPRVADPEARLAAFQSVTGELTRRGLDADSLVRYGLRNEIMASLLGALLVHELGLSIPGQASRGIDINAWSGALPKLPDQADDDGTLSVDRLLRLVKGIAELHVPLILSWIMHAPLSDLVTLPAPHVEQMTRPPVSSADVRLYERYAWLVDRFSTTSLRDWLTSSLQCEYRWLAEQEPLPCPAALMLDRDVDVGELHGEIARRSVLNIGTGGPDPEAVLAAEMAGHAEALLEQGRCREAAAIFEFAARRRPDDAEARNNLGFCLIPENPKQALFDLDSAARMGCRHVVVNVYNRVCCYLALRQPKAAIAAAEAYWTAMNDEPGGATLWHWAKDGSWAITHVIDAHLALAELAVTACQAEGWREEELIWRRRVRSRQPAIRPGAADPPAEARPPG